jgi:RNA polymerase sigma-70 factor, ECF subfamily
VTINQAMAPDFEAATAAYRRQLFAHCYRMTGSLGEAEDLVQETYLRAWRAFDRFEQRSSVQTWLYRIATNVCLTWLDGRTRRPMPSGLAPPSPYFHEVARDTGEVPWLEPVPDRLVLDERGDPAEVVSARSSVRLALVAALQMLPLRQRAAIILCDALGVPAADAAELLETSVAAIKSLLQRARARLAEAELTDDGLAEPTNDKARHVLDRYLAAFEQSDVAAMARLLADDAVLEMTGTTTWFSGKATCLGFIAARAIGQLGDWRMLPIAANGQLAAAAYHRGDDGAYHPYAIVVLSTTTSHITRISLFSDPALFLRFELPPALPAG